MGQNGERCDRLLVPKRACLGIRAGMRLRFVSDLRSNAETRNPKPETRDPKAKAETHAGMQLRFVSPKAETHAGMQLRFVSEFRSNAEVIDAVCCSMGLPGFIAYPLYSSWPAWSGLWCHSTHAHILLYMPYTYMAHMRVYGMHAYMHTCAYMALGQRHTR